ncbi:hypothetical protein CEXT_260521 [Caerostris extrusa]|uniref:Uncharacterized protein n=1 Tax=Caerostris extrusa TaxID=172846 RepID=A0AAV4UFG1_CAEEX|nr:hypothetical protein CEXT_260521 [Caerostris extrusa]
MAEYVNGEDNEINKSKDFQQATFYEIVENNPFFCKTLKKRMSCVIVRNPSRAKISGVCRKLKVSRFLWINKRSTNLYAYLFLLVKDNISTLCVLSTVLFDFESNRVGQKNSPIPHTTVSKISSL